MLGNIMGSFISILIGVSLIGPISQQTNIAGAGLNATGGCGGYIGNSTNTWCSDLYNSSTWGATVMKMVPGFFALGVLGTGVAVTYSALRQAGIV